MYIIESMQNMNACMALPNQSKYSDSIAGTPTVRKGTPARISPRNPGSHPKSAWLATVRALYRSVVMTPPETMFPK